MENKYIFDRSMQSRAVSREGIRRWGVHDKMPEGVYGEGEDDVEGGGGMIAIEMNNEGERNTKKNRDKARSKEGADEDQEMKGVGGEEEEEEEDEEAKIQELERAEEKRDIKTMLDEFVKKYCTPEGPGDKRPRIRVEYVEKGVDKSEIKVGCIYIYTFLPFIYTS